MECLSWTVGIGTSEVALLDLCRRKRHTNVYEQVGATSDQEADEMIALAIRLRTQVLDWLRSRFAHLMPPLG